jgi:hypothetical protein
MAKRSGLGNNMKLIWAVLSHYPPTIPAYVDPTSNRWAIRTTLSHLVSEWPGREGSALEDRRRWHRTAAAATHTPSPPSSHLVVVVRAAAQNLPPTHRAPPPTQRPSSTDEGGSGIHWRQRRRSRDAAATDWSSSPAPGAPPLCWPSKTLDPLRLGWWGVASRPHAPPRPSPRVLGRRAARAVLGRLLSTRRCDPEALRTRRLLII